MDEPDRLALLQRRQEATDMMLVESQAWVVRLAALHQPQPAFSRACSAAHTVCSTAGVRQA